MTWVYADESAGQLRVGTPVVLEDGDAARKAAPDEQPDGSVAEVDSAQGRVRVDVFP